jgi:hypothetical protein
VPAQPLLPAPITAPWSHKFVIIFNDLAIIVGFTGALRHPPGCSHRKITAQRHTQTQNFLTILCNNQQK